MTDTRATVWRLPDLTLAPAEAHGGSGVRADRFEPGGDPASAIHFLDHVEVEPGGSIGRHRHGLDEEEFYLVLAGRGLMYLDGAEFPVQTGDLVRNRPGGEHGLVNVGEVPLRLFVFEIAAGHAVAGR